MTIRTFCILIGLPMLGSSMALEAANSPQPPGTEGGAGGWVRAIKVLPDKAPDCSSLSSIAKSVTRGCESDDAKAIAIYNFMNLAHYHRQYPGEPGGIPVLKEINCYGWSLCGGLHSEQSALWRELGWDWRFVGWSGHTTVEAQYGGRWHYLDVFLKFYAWMPDGRGGRTIAGEDDLAQNSQALVTDAFEMDKFRGCVYAKDNPFVMSDQKANWQAPAFLSCGDGLEDVVSGLKTHHGRDRSEGWADIRHATGDYSAEVDLAPGYCLENTWDPKPDAWYWAGSQIAPGHTCSGHKDTRNDPAYGLVLEPYIDSKPVRCYGNGTLIFAPDFAGDAILRAFVSVENVRHAGGKLVPAEAGKRASVVFSLKTPYILTRASGEAAGADAVEVSVDGGKTFKAVDLKEFSGAVKGHVDALVKVTFKDALEALRVEAVVQNNPGALPYLSPGRNLVTVSLADARALGSNRLVVTYAFRLGSRAKSFEQLCDRGKEIARQHDAKWSDTITCVQKTFAATDLPATFQINCPTAKGRYPVYPRMLFLRREVLAPGSKPLPLPEGAVEAGPADDDELVSLPDPFLIGSAAPEPIQARAVKTARIPLAYIQFVGEGGEVSGRGTLRWPKNEGESGKVIRGAVIVGGDLKGLSAKGLAAARLMVPVAGGHDKAPGKLGAVMLKKPVEPGKACDVKALAETIGTVVIPKQPVGTPEYRPAKVFAMDVTPGVKAVASGEAKFHGFALRIVPDRGVDDGWTVRCDISPAGEVWLEVDTYMD